MNKLEAFETDECTPGGNHAEAGIKDCEIIDAALCVQVAHIARQYRDSKRRHDIELEYAALFASAPDLKAQNAKLLAALQSAVEPLAGSNCDGVVLQRIHDAIREAKEGS